MKKLTKLGVLLLTVIMLISALSIPAFADVTSLPDGTTARVLNIYKYSPTNATGAAGTGAVDGTAANGRVPLQDVEFEIYKLAPAATVTLGTTPADNGVTVNTTTYVPTIPADLNATLVTTIKTDSTGLATYGGFAADGTDDGTYLIVEKFSSAIVTPVAPFYVSIPMTNTTMDGWLYTVTVYPKNDVPAGPTVDKNVDSLGTKSATHNVGDTETWIIRGTVPADLYRSVGTPAADVYAVNYSFTDVLPTTLDYKGNLIVKLFDKAGNETVLDATNYNTTGTTAVADAAGGTIAVALTDAGKKLIQTTLDAQAQTGTPEIRVCFDTAINATATMGTIIPNNVTLNYTNSANNVYDPDTLDDGNGGTTDERPEVHMGGLVIDKYKTGTTTKLSGAKFKVARDIVTGETKAETITVNGVAHDIVWVDFYNVALPSAAAATKVSEVTTGADGAALINGLAYGTYYLVETAAPNGYNLLSAPMTVTVTATSHNATGEVVQVANSSKFVLPITGGNGTMLFTMGGVLLIGLAILLIVASGKKKHAAK